MSERRKLPPTAASLPRRITYALTGAAIAAMSLPLVAGLLPGEASASRSPMGVNGSTVFATVLPTGATVARSTLPVLTGTATTFTPGVYANFTVGTGICTVEVLVSGAAGGTLNGGVGGRGAAIRGQFAVAAGSTYTLTVGAYRGGGAGGVPPTSLAPGNALNGGAASRIVQNSNSALIIEAAGGGGDAAAIITRTNASQDTIPNPVLPGTTNPPMIQVAANPGKGGDAPGTTAVSPQTAAVNVPVIDANTAPTSTSIVPKSVSASANGSASASGAGVLTREITPSTIEQIARAQVDIFAGGAGGGGSAASGGAAADGGSVGTNVFPTTTLSTPDPNPPTTYNMSAPFAIGAAVGGSGGLNTIGNGFLTLAQGVNDQLDGRIMVRQIACGSSGSTLPPLGGGNGTGPLLPAAIVLFGAGLGLLAVRRRSHNVGASA